MYCAEGVSRPHCTGHECTSLRELAQKLHCTLLEELVLKLLAYVTEGACTKASTDFADLASTQRQVVQRHELKQMQKTKFNCSGRFQASYLFTSATAREAYNQAHMMYSAEGACTEALLNAHC